MLRWTAVLTMLAMLLATVPSGMAQEETEVRQDILSQEGKDITFYGRALAITADSPMPMNTQYPEGEEDFSAGYDGGCGTPAEGDFPAEGQGLLVTSTPDSTCYEYTQNELYWYTTAGFVQVKSGDEWSGYEQFHNERGQTKDIYLDTSKNPIYTLHMSADAHGWLSTFGSVGAGWNWDPGYFQDWSVEAWVWHASLGDWSTDPSAKPSMGPIRDCFLSEDWENCDGVTLVAHGQSEPRDLWSLDPTIPVEQAEATVWPFSAPMEWGQKFLAEDGIVPYQNDLIVQFEWYQETDGERYLTPQINWNLNSGEDYPNNIVLPVRNPLDVELVFPRFVHDKLVVLSIINTPWGSYDIDNKMTQLIIKDAAGNVVDIDPETLQSDIDSSVAHAGHYKPINATWVWDYQSQGLAPGEYTVEVEVTNFQHSYTTSTVASFSLDEEGSGTTTAGRSGLASYTDSDFEAFKEGAGIGDGTDGQEVEPADEGGPDESQGSPGFAALAAIMLMPAIALFLRRRSQ